MRIEQEDDGRWIAEVPPLSGVLAYGATAAEARTRAVALALRVMADRIEHGEPVPAEAGDLFAAALTETSPRSTAETTDGAPCVRTAEARSTLATLTFTSVAAFS